MILDRFPRKKKAPVKSTEVSALSALHSGENRILRGVWTIGLVKAAGVPPVGMLDCWVLRRYCSSLQVWEWGRRRLQSAASRKGVRRHTRARWSRPVLWHAQGKLWKLPFLKIDPPSYSLNAGPQQRAADAFHKKRRGTRRLPTGWILPLRGRDSAADFHHSFNIKAALARFPERT